MGDLFCAALRMHYDYFKFRDRHHISDEKLKYIHEWKKQAKEETKNEKRVTKDSSDTGNQKSEGETNK
jgi:hypothetical protein